MNKMFIIIGIPLVLLLSSCSTYKAVLYPYDFNKYKCFRSKFSGGYDQYRSNIISSVFDGARSSGLTSNVKDRDDTLILTVGTTNAFIFPPSMGGHLEYHFSWDYPPKTATIIATDSVTGGKLFEICYSRYTISMDSSEFLDRIKSAVEYCIEEMKKIPPKDAPREITISTSVMSEITKRRYKRNSFFPAAQKSDTEE
jgi:hypothetical protein